MFLFISCGVGLGVSQLTPKKDPSQPTVVQRRQSDATEVAWRGMVPAGHQCEVDGRITI